MIVYNYYTIILHILLGKDGPMAKTRLDIMLDEEDKSKLQTLASIEGCSVSEMVRRLIADHIAADARIPTETDAFDAVADVMRIQQIFDAFKLAYRHGMVYAFSRYCELHNAGQLPEMAEDIAFVYDDSASLNREGDRFAIVADKCVNADHEDIVSKWSDMLFCSDVRLVDCTDIAEYDCEPYYLEVVRKWSPSVHDGDLDLFPEDGWPGEAVGAL